MPNVDRMHHGARSKIYPRIEPIKEADEYDPAQARPIEDKTGLCNRMSQAPASILRSIDANSFKRPLVLFRLHSKSPAVELVRPLDDRLDALADEDKAPIHGLPFSAGGDSGEGEFQAGRIG